ncbi:DUF4864 domain-containing protein [Porticoccus sp.]
MSCEYFVRHVGQYLLVLFVACLSPLALAEEPLPDEDRQAVQWVINSQISAFRADDSQSAYSFAAPNVRQVFPTEEIFISMVQRDYMPLYRPVSYKFGRSSLEAGEVLQELLVTDGERQLWQIIYTLEQQDDLSWKVSNVLMLPYKGVSA